MDCTDAALAAGVDPLQSIAVDGFFGFERRIVAMTNPATTGETRADAHALLAATGKPVSFLRDSLGFAAPRIVASIVNLACSIAQQGVATPDDINRAVQLGLGYPQGPLNWGDKLGAGRILALLQALLTATGDPRYRPAEWLVRRAKLGISLTALEA
jgi:3-hydroxybutyryl-CoA dehydrogenase